MIKESFTVQKKLHGSEEMANKTVGGLSQCHNSGDILR
jgi:hypothetical protein